MFSLYLATALIFVALDAAALKLALQPLLRRHLGDALRARLRAGPAALFYLAYVAGLVWLVSLPAMIAGDPLAAAFRGAVLGALAFGTSELTAMAMLRGWTWRIVAAGLLRGTLATGFAAGAGVWLVLRFA